jgi:heme exporter protein B
MKKALSKIFAIFRKDLLNELRAKEITVSVLVFVLLILVIFTFTFDMEADQVSTSAPGILWVALTFGGVIGLNRTFAIEKEDSRLEGLLLCPMDHAVIFWGKLAGVFTFMLIIAAVITPVFLALFNLPLFLPRLALVIVLALLGFAAVGTLFAAVAVNIRSRDIMLPVLFLPVVAPVVIAAVKATGPILAGMPWGEIATWLQIIAAFDIIYLVVATLVFEFVVEE